jgi:hypothetical protein
MSQLDSDFEKTLVQGDVFLLQSVPALERNCDDLPPRVHLVGAATEPLPMPSARRDLRQCSPSDWTLVGDFAHAFPYLTSEIKADHQNQTLLLADFDRRLSDEARSGKRDFDIFGVKIGK